jgi:hypothetical protein
MTKLLIHNWSFRPPAHFHRQAAKSFVSFVRAYSKHEASYIFRVKDLDLVGVATSFGLLRLPKMPELKDRDRQRWVDADVDVSSSRPLVFIDLFETFYSGIPMPTPIKLRRRNGRLRQQAGLLP